MPLPSVGRGNLTGYVMITVRVDSGACGFISLVRAHRIHRKGVGIAIKSKCEQVVVFGASLQRMNAEDIVKTPLYKNAVYEKASKCGLHPECLVPCGAIKAAEAELGMTSTENASIVFQNGSRGKDHA